uniref:Transposase Tc1-like domain-containing protein n=1 Tax=Neolamprologus brichardi TaxID=32507 RepID=A0A3Q4I8K2_NEOBR
GGYKVISKQLKVHFSTVRKIIHKTKTFKIAASVPMNGHLRPSKITPRSEYDMLNVKVHGNAIRKRLNMCSLFGSAIRKKPARTMTFGQTRQKWKCLSAIHFTIFSKNRTQQRLIPTVKQVATGLGPLTVIKLTMNSSVHKNILKSDLPDS